MKGKIAGKHPDYYEALIQLRGSVSDEVLNFVGRHCGEYISKIEEVKGGFDVYLIRTSVGKKIGQMLKKTFRAQIKKSFRLVTRRDGRNVYRTIICARIYNV